ncbi:reovirus sigma C capsid domain-containing protein [Rhizoctonia solani]|uniref:Reovirus sigma C capsid domain-containing protein n=1 Tax=Rhizoctonia solani TaxID=456999 RepID=A0A8H8NU13_9AGAM|nr:reovirus sigma C capsid domain-containing protein [Rhizoctonia solani]QRW19525.1 reovirus sigma C capsid domain-containing protein [Rhizoctonia solani]
MARHRSARPSVASMVSTTSTNGTRSRSKLSYEQSALLTLAENSLKRQKKPLNISAIVKDAERRAQEQGLSLGVQARTRIKKAVEKLSDNGAITEAPRKGRAPFQYSLTPKAVKAFNDAKSHRRSNIGIAKEMSDTLKGNDRPTKRRRSSMSAGVISSSQPSQHATIEKLKLELAVARSEIKSLKQSNQSLLDQQLDDDDDYDTFGSPTRKALSSQRSVVDSPIRPSGKKGLSFLGRHTRPTTPEPTEHGSPEYEAPEDIDYTNGIDAEREFTPPNSSPPDAMISRFEQFEQEPQILQERAQTEIKLKQHEASVSELTLEKARMAEEIATLKNQVQHERGIVAHLTQEKHEADLVRVELTQAYKDHDSTRRDLVQLEREKVDLEARCASMNLSQQELKILVSKAEVDIKAHMDIQSQLRATLISTNQELETANTSLLSSQEEARRLTESLAVAEATIAVLNENVSARESSYKDLQETQSLAAEQLRTLRSEVQSLRDTLSFAEDRATTAEAIAAERNLQIGGLQADREAMQTTVIGLREQKEELARENVTLMSRIKGSDALVADLRTQVEHMSSEAGALQGLVVDLRSSLDAAQLEKDAAEAKFEIKRSELSHRIADCEKANLEATRATEKLQDDLKASNSQLSDRKAEIIRLNSSLAGLRSEIKVLKDAKDIISSKLHSSVEETKKLNQRAGELQRQDEANIQEINRLKADLVHHKNSIEEHQDVISKLELQLDSLRNHKIESLRKRRARVEAEAKRLKDEEAELTQEAIDVDQWDETLSQSRAARSSLAPSFAIMSSP